MTTRQRIQAALWDAANDLNFREIREVTDAAMAVAQSKIMEIRREKFLEAGKPEKQTQPA